MRSYTHVIGRFPNCCPLSEQEQAVLTQLCTKLNKFFQEGKQIKATLEDYFGIEILHHALHIYARKKN